MADKSRRAKSRLEPAERRPARILVVHKKSLYQLYIIEHRDNRIESLIEQGDVTVAALRSSHDVHLDSMEAVVKCLNDRDLSFTLVYRAYLLPVRGFDLVITVGGDGTALDASHFIGSTPLFAVNSDPPSSVGHFCAASAVNFGERLDAYMDGQLTELHLNRLAIRHNDEPFWASALNDVLIAHPIPAATSNFLIDVDGTQQRFKCSGLWISTAAGSTAAIASSGGEEMDPTSTHLQYLVREPFIRPGETSPMTQGFVESSQQLTIISKMRRGMVYLDGPHLSLPVTMGDRIHLSNHEHPLRLVTPEVFRVMC